MKKIIQISLSSALFLSLFSAPVFSEAQVKEDHRLPLGCRDTGYQFELKTVQLSPGPKGDQQSMYFLFNVRAQPVSLYQMRDEESSRSMYLNHAIQSRQWAVLSTSEQQVKFICAVPDAKSSYGKIVDCAESIKVCEYTNVRYGLNNRGNYWLVNSNTRDGALQEVLRYGIIPAQ